jgi:maleate cis-trans isomerase
MLYCCMATGLVKGPGWTRGFTERLKGLTQAAVATASDLTMQALIALGVQRLAVVTPYPNDVAERVASFFSAHGFEVVAEKHMPAKDIQSVNDYPPETAYRLVRSLDLFSADGVCILATDFRTLEALAPLEKDLCKPVVSTNQAIMWGGLHIAGIKEKISGCGRLLAELPPLPPLPTITG